MGSEMEPPTLISKINRRYQDHFQWMILDTEFHAVMMMMIAFATTIVERIRVG